MNNKPQSIIFLDIDGTLIQPNQQPNSQNLPNLIQNLLEKNILCGLNSNRALEDLKPVYEKFSLSGPLVAENGVYYLKNLNDSPHFTINNPPFLKTIIDRAIKNFITSQKISFEYKVTDTTKEIINNSFESVPHSIHLNTFRLYTASIHVYEYANRDPQTAHQLAHFIKEYCEKHNIDVQVTVPEMFGNIIVWPSGASKGNALQFLHKKYPQTSFYMIGDDTPDLDTLEYVDGFFAVGNASENVKEKANYVSKETYTKGVIDILTTQF